MKNQLTEWEKSLKRVQDMGTKSTKMRILNSAYKRSEVFSQK